MFSPLGLQETLIINMLGDVVHSWDLPYEPGNFSCLLPSGNLLSGVRTPDAGGTATTSEAGKWIAEQVAGG